MKFAALGAAVALAFAAPAFGQAQIGSDPTATVAGAYQLDPNHASVIVRIPHQGGVSYSTFRFGKASGTLNWQPAAPATSKIDITVEMGSIQTPVEGFAAELLGEMFLNTAAYPEAKFTSTAITVTGAKTGTITGNLTWRGQTHPMTVNAQFVGGGKNGRGVPVVGFTGTGKFTPSAYGAGGPVAQGEVELILDLEFRGAAG